MRPRLTFPLLCAMLLLPLGCEKRASSPATAPAARVAKSPAIASLVPSATDLLVAMHADDHLVAVSGFDPKTPPIDQLPRVGDFQSIDWEQLSVLRPAVMLIFMSADRMPAGLKEHADALSIRIENMSIERLNDIFSAIDRLGELADERAEAKEFGQSLRGRLDAIAKKANGQPRVRTLVVIDDDGAAAIGRETFVDDLLTLVGGDNVVTAKRYPTLDREQIIALGPQVIVQLLPGASEAVKSRARLAWTKLPAVPAVRDGRIIIIDDPFALQPGAHVDELAAKLAKAVHPE